MEVKTAQTGADTLDLSISGSAIKVSAADGTISAPKVASPLGEPGPFVDITASFLSAAKSLPVGQMIHSEEFTLFKGMSALEMMDAKMDPGMFRDKVPNLDAMIASNELVMDPSPPDVLAIMDELLACEASWHRGDSLGHTVFTCLYAHRPTAIRHAALNAYVLVLLKTCEKVKAVVSAADVYDEEDFNPAPMGLSLVESCTPEQALAALNQVESQLEKQRVAALKSSGASAQDSSQISAKKAEDALLNALLVRLRFRKTLLTLHSQLAKPECRGVGACEKLCSKALADLDAIEATSGLASEVAPGFNAYITRNLVPHAPPREPHIMPRSKAVAYYRELLNHVKLLIALPSFESFDDTVSYVQALSTSNPGIVLRSHMLVLLGSADKFLTGRTLASYIGTSCQNFSQTSAKASSLQPEAVATLLSRIAKAVWHVFRLCAQNRSRQRRAVGKMLSDWSILEDESSQVDHRICISLAHLGVDLNASNAPCRAPYSTWVCDQTLQLLCHHLMLGFELELYAPREYPQTFWYGLTY